MLRMLWLLVGLFTRSFRSRREVLLENLALRQQLTVLKLRRPQPRFRGHDRHLERRSRRRDAEELRISFFGGTVPEVSLRSTSGYFL